LDKYPISSKSLEKHYHIDGNQFSQQYKDHLSDFNQWDQKSHAHKWMLFPENIGPKLSIDETALTNGELYTIITNKVAKGRKGALVAMVQGTRSENVISILKKIPESIRGLVEEVTLDMAGSMNKIVQKSFPKASRVIDRFHIQKLAYDGLQEMRIAHRWDALNEESKAIREANYREEKYQPVVFDNGDSKKQLLARSRYLLFKSANNWTKSQKKRAEILFAQYPDIQEAYILTHNLRLIFTQTKEKGIAYTKLAHWFRKVEESGFKAFTSIKNTIQNHYQGILNYFENRSTNASAESFNAKLKAFRASLRGVRDINFFLFRVAKIYA
jgi:transposase